MEEDLLTPLDTYLKVGLHIGTKFRTKYMEPFIYKVRGDGLAVMNVKKISERLAVAAKFMSQYNPEDILIVCRRESGWKPAALFSKLTGIKAIKLREDDELVETKLTNGRKEIIIATKMGQAVRFHEEDVRPTGRASMGVRGARLRSGDEVVGMSVVEEDSVLLTLTENGYGKRSRVSDYRKTKRGAQGVRNLKTNEKTGKVVTVREVSGDDELIVTSQKGMVIRVPVRGIRIMGRATQGVRVMRLKKGDRVVSVARLAQD